MTTQRIKACVRVAFIWALMALPAVYELGCKSDRTTYTTLASTEMAVKLSYDGYVDSVIKGQMRTNELPVIAASFDSFQAAMRIAITRASGNTNAQVTDAISNKAAVFIDRISHLKGVK